MAFFVCLPLLSSAQKNPTPSASTDQSGAVSPPETQVPALSPRPAPAPTPKNADGRIHLDVVVTDKSGKPISGLALNDFKLLDNNQLNPILSFQAIDENVQKVGPPVEVILLIDTVNIGFQQVSFVRQQVQNFLLQNGGHLAQPVSVFMLTNDGVEAQPRPSSDGNALAAGVNQLETHLRTISRSAGAWGAIERMDFSIRMMMGIADNEARKPGRKLLIWASSGWPMLDSPRIITSSKSEQHDFDAIVRLSTRLREARISVYSISQGTANVDSFLYQEFLKRVKTSERASPPNLALKVLAVQSGGRVVGPDNDMTAQIGNCVRDASSFYTLSFDPPRADRANEYHDLKVQIDKPGLTARTNTGYYNQP